MGERKELLTDRRQVTHRTLEGAETMESGAKRIDLKKLFFYLLKRCWLIILCAAIGFAGMYWYTAYKQTDTYTASASVRWCRRISRISCVLESFFWQLGHFSL